MAGSDQGAALTAEQILYEGREPNPSTATSDPKRSDQDPDAAGAEERCTAKPSANETKTGLSDALLADSADVDSSSETIRPPSAAVSTRLGDGFQAHGRYFRLSMVASVAVAVAVSSSGVSTVGVISAAQVCASCTTAMCCFVGLWRLCSNNTVGVMTMVYAHGKTCR